MYSSNLQPLFNLLRSAVLHIIHTFLMGQIEVSASRELDYIVVNNFTNTINNNPNPLILYQLFLVKLLLL